MPPQPPQQPQTTPPVAPQQPQPNYPAQPQPVASPQPPAYAAPEKKRFPKWLKIVGIIVAIFVVIIVIAAVTATTATKAPQKISDQFVNEVQAGNTSAAYNLTSKTFQDATTQAQLDQLIKQVGPLLQGEEKVSGRAIEKSTGVPQTAVLVYDVETSNGKKYIKVELQKSGDAWQVINFRSSETPLDAEVE